MFVLSHRIICRLLICTTHHHRPSIHGVITASCHVHSPIISHAVGCTILAATCYMRLRSWRKHSATSGSMCLPRSPCGRRLCCCESMYCIHSFVCCPSRYSRPCTRICIRPPVIGCICHLHCPCICPCDRRLMHTPRRLSATALSLRQRRTSPPRCVLYTHQHRCPSSSLDVMHTTCVCCILTGITTHLFVCRHTPRVCIAYAHPQPSV